MRGLSSARRRPPANRRGVRLPRKAYIVRSRYTYTYTCPSLQSLRESVLSTISQDPGTSVSEYWIRLPVRLSCKAEPWHCASPEGHSAAPRHLRLF